MTKNNSRKLLALLMSLVLITSCFVGGTLARYITSTSSEDSARVAVWGINADEVEMDLFDGSYTVNGVTVANSEDGDNIIAPGTSKDSKFSIVNLNENLAPEVMYEVKIDIDDSEIDQRILNNPSIQWRLDESTYGTWKETKAKILALSGHESGVKTYAPLEIAENFKAGITHTIGWTWLMDNNNDEMDTQMGNDAVDGDISAKIVVNVTAKQVDGVTIGMLNTTKVFDLNNENAVLTFSSIASANKFQSVKIDNETVPSDKYDVTSGSTIITFNDDYARTLTVGNHVIEIISTDMTARTSFKVIQLDNVLTNNTWEEIIFAVQSNVVPDTWQVGDKKEMLINGTEYMIQIIGKNHDDYSDGSGKAPLTFQLVDCYVNSQMHTVQNNSASWINSALRTTYMNSFFDELPKEIKNGIKEVNKKTIKGNTSNQIQVTADKLFILSEIEFNGTTIYSGVAEGEQYAFYKNGGSKSKLLNGQPAIQWLRTPALGVHHSYVGVDTDGSIAIAYPHNQFGISFAFCF